MMSAGMMGEEGASSIEHHYLLQEMRAQNLDAIRFSSYRTGCKLRFVQKKANLNAIDIWNVIEAFRENGLNTLEPQTEVNVTRLETLVSSLYHNLNKRLPPAQQVNVETSSSLLLNWLLAAYSVENVGKIRVFSIKVALATMCAGKLMDKWRYIFSQISDGNGQLVLWRFEEYLQEVLALPAAVYESPSFHYTPELSANIFTRGQKVTVNDFMDTMMSDPGPACLVWLPLLHRLAAVENVVHPIVCDACHRENFSGFRYRCQKCHNFQMCQECFWRGRLAGTHTNEHEVKEYTSYKSPSKQIGHSLRKSFRCVPDKGRPNIPRFPEEPEKTLNLSHIVPPSPLPSHNGFGDGSLSAPYDVGSMDSRSTTRRYRCSSPGKYSSILDAGRMDDEHRLIARYAARLAAEARSGRSSSDILSNNDTSRAQRELISQLEAKNREIMREITRLRVQQELESTGLGSDGVENPALMSELRALRQRKDELEGHLISLQDSRKQLMIQLESLMKLLKNHQASPRSTPNSSPRSTKSPPLTGPVPSSLSGPIPPPSSRSAPPTPGSQMMPSEPGMNLFGVGGYSHTGPPSVSSSPVSGGRSLRNDLLVAADSVTNAMSTLVRELNSEGSDEDGADGTIRKPLDLGVDDGSDSGGELATLHAQAYYQQHASKVDCNYSLGQLSADTQEQLRKLEHSEQTFARGVGDSSLPDWEESLKRWVNR